MEDERLISTSLRSEDEAEGTLRPHSLAEYFGQQKIKDSLAIYMQAALTRHEPLDHILLYGPPGLGKTTLAGIIAAEMGHNIRITSGPAIERAGDLATHTDQPQRGRRAVHRRDPPPVATRSRRCSIRRWRTTRWTS